MTSELRAATIRCIQETVCLAFSRAVYEEVISGGNVLVGKDTSDNVDWSTDHETRSLFKHIENILEISQKTTSPEIRRILYELSTAFTPELSVDEIISRMVLTVKTDLKADRVGLFVLSEDRRSMVLKISERSKGIRLPVRGLAGAVLQDNAALNIADAYKDARFDATMDRRTGYRTRQVLGVPVRHPVTGDAVGILQVNNRTDGSFEPFRTEQQHILELAAQQLSELLHGRTEAFIHTPNSSNNNSRENNNLNSNSNNLSKPLSLGSIDGTSVTNTAECDSNLQIEMYQVSFTKSMLEVMVREGIVSVEISVSLYLALCPLCEPQVLALPLPKRLGEVVETSIVSLLINDRVTLGISVRDLPRAARILFRLGGRRRNSKAKGDHRSLVPLGWTATTVFDFKGCLLSLVDLKFFLGDIAVPINTTLSNTHDPNLTTSMSLALAPDLFLDTHGEFRSNSRIVHTMPTVSSPLTIDANSRTLTPAHEQELNRIRMLSFNPICMSIITEADKEYIWDLRQAIFDRPEMLPAFVMSVNWASASLVQELYTLLELWALPTPVNALMLLDRRFMDPKVRAVAVHCLEELGDEDLALYMMQLCQQLKFENHTDSALARFLLRRSLQNQRLIGHIFFWFLHSELHNLDVKRRFSVLLQVYVRNCGNHRIELGHQMFVMKRLERVAELVKEGETKSSRLEILKEQLRLTVLPPEFQLPLNPHIKVCGIDINKCRVMESKKKPLWLTLKNADTSNGNSSIVLMLKVGDDLRQDALILQLLRVMEELWRREGLDMQMCVYDCISTGLERGLLQVVLNASTLGSILMASTDNKTAASGKKTAAKSGSLSRKIGAAMKALSDFDVLRDWIWEQVVNDIKGSETKRQAEMERRIQHFMISTAAYCVASYVLGIGDRHNDNLMLTKTAHFFHIDFGHILGNFKSKYGVKRERAPFVFTPAMKAVMRPEQYESFVDLCCDIYNVLRENAELLVSLCSLAIPCNLPELQEEKDVMWIYDKLLVGKSDEEAAEHFRKELELSLHTRGTRINDAAHMLAHA